MFETAEIGHRVSKKEFAEAAIELRSQLLASQRRLRDAGFQTLVIVSGVEAAGKSEVVNRLHEWLDARGIQTAVFWDESDEERERPSHWRFWRRMPPRGTIGILFGSWYTQPIVARAYRKLKRADLESELERINRLERMLADDGAILVKLWFHLSKKAQSKRLRKIAKSESRKLTPWEKKFSENYDRFLEVTEIAVRETDTGHAPWHVIESEDRRYRDLMAGRILARALEERLARAEEPEAESAPVEEPGRRVTVLDRVDLKSRLTLQDYESRLFEAQSRLNAFAWGAREQRRSVVALFEGWDAAGKGGAIRRVTAALDARLFRVIPVAAPTDEERAQHYLWRFWRHLPRAGYVTIYDRSWYGRVLVERVEGFARGEEWGRAYQEINDFERQLTDFGIVLAKFWLHISEEEQLRRFRERESVAYKMHKITEEDWRNRERWRDYEDAVEEMVARCSTAAAPWTVVPANDKRFARVTIVETLADRIERGLAGSVP
jgi:polyphosphate:AMP phosphotransferase